MLLILSYFMFLLLCLMRKVLSAYSEKETFNSESIGLTCFGIPVLAYVWGWILEAGLISGTGTVLIKSVLGFMECFGVVFFLIVGCCLLEYHIMGNLPNALQVLRKKGIRAILVLGICMLLSGVCGGVSYLPEERLYRVLTDINEYFGYWMIFLSYGIVSITFFITNVTRERLGNGLKRWKAQDGLFLLLLKVIIVASSIFVKTLLFINLAQPSGVTFISVKYHWIRELGNLLFRWQYDGFKYWMLYIMPLLIVLYIVAVILKKNKNKTDVVWGSVVFAECFFTGWIGQILWLGSWM